MPYTVLIADDNLTVRRSLRSLIESSTDWRVCGEAENGEVAVEKVQALSPDVLILDLAMPVMNGLEAARRITQVAPDVAMVMFTMHANEQLAREAEVVGIRRIASKAEGAKDLVSTIRSLLAEKRTAGPDNRSKQQ